MENWIGYGPAGLNPLRIHGGNMFINIFSSVITFLLAISVLFALRKEDGKITKWGKTVIALAAFASVTTIYQTYHEYARQRDLRLSDIHITLVATWNYTFKRDEELLVDSPPGIPNMDVYVDGFHCKMDLEREPGIFRPWGGKRDAIKATLVYHAPELRPVYNDSKPVPFTRFGDLDEKNIRTRLPLHYFKVTDDRGNWGFLLEVEVGDKRFYAAPKDGDNFEFTLN